MSNKVLKCPNCQADTNHIMIRGTRVPWEMLTSTESKAAGHCAACGHVGKALTFIVDGPPDTIPLDRSSVFSLAFDWFVPDDPPLLWARAISITDTGIVLADAPGGTNPIELMEVSWMDLAARWKHGNRPDKPETLLPCTRPTPPTTPA